MNKDVSNINPFILVLGTAQDKGYSQCGWSKKCCFNLNLNKILTNFVSSLGLVILKENKSYIFDCTPDFKSQLNLVNKYVNSIPSVIFLTHAHIGRHILD